jgi:hypothetical protein
MNQENFTRKQRRQIQKLGELVDKATQSDRRFFERRPDREHRLRRADRAEILQTALLSNGEFDIHPPPGLAWFVAVKNLCNGARLRQLAPFLENADADLAPEQHCKEFRGVGRSKSADPRGRETDEGDGVRRRGDTGMNDSTRPPPMDPWDRDVRGIDVPIADGNNGLPDDVFFGFERDDPDPAAPAEPPAEPPPENFDADYVETDHGETDTPAGNGHDPDPPSDDPPPAGNTKLSPNKADISAHLYALFDPAFVHGYPDAKIEIAYSDSGGNLNQGQYFAAFDLVAAAKFAAAKNLEGRNVYVRASIGIGWPYNLTSCRRAP